jgi:hypothetical protein
MIYSRNYLVVVVCTFSILPTSKCPTKNSPAIAAALGSSTISICALYPLVIVRRNLQMIRSAESLSAVTVARNTWKSLGIRGFYRGIVPQFVQLTPQNILGFVLFEYWRRTMQSK